MSIDGESKKRPSIPAPGAVPRPSRLPPASASRRDSAVEPTPLRDGGGRRGTLDGIAPYGRPVEDDFDAERTMVFDEDGPTADYDPRAQGMGPISYDPRTRGIFQTPISEAPGAAAAPVIPGPPAVAQISAPRPSEAGRRRTSRRTLKVTDPPKGDRADSEHGEKTPTDPSGPDGSPGTRTSSPPSRAARRSVPPLGDPMAFDEDGMVDEVTTVRPLRIIDVGSEPAPPINSAHASWPPAGEGAWKEPGWTPAPPTEPTSGLEAQERTSPDGDEELPGGDDREEISLEELEPDHAAPIIGGPVSLPAKKPPPPPPRNKSEPSPKTESRPAEPPPKAWWDDLFSDEYLRTFDRIDPTTLRREVNFIEESLGVETHAVVLDLACGTGDHAVELAARGYSVVGLDYSPGMLSLAEQTLKDSQRHSPGLATPQFVQGDMRELAYEEAFDAVYSWSTSFGFFDDEKNAAVLGKIYRSLKKGGLFLIDVINRDYVTPRSPSLVWFEGDRCICMDDMHVDYFSSRLRVKRTAMFEGGSSRELEYSIRLYSLSELGKMLHDVGFKVLDVTGHPCHPGVFFGSESPRLIVLAERA